MPLTKKQAEVLCADYQHLQGKYIEVPDVSQGTVHRVVVAPYDPVSKEIFLQEYYRSGDLQKAMGTYESELFTVILLIDYEGQPTTIGLRRYLADSEPGFDPYKYLNI